jgi:hypothetical protein
LSYSQLPMVPMVGDRTPQPRRPGELQATTPQPRDPESRASSSISIALWSNWTPLSDVGFADELCAARMDRTSRHAQRVVRV